MLLLALVFVSALGYNFAPPNRYSGSGPFRFGLTDTDVTNFFGWYNTYPPLPSVAYGVTTGGRDPNGYGLPTWYVNELPRTVPASSSGPDRVYWLTDGVYQSIVQTKGNGAIIIDCPPNLSTNVDNGGGFISRFLAQQGVTLKTIIYTHRHEDHIGGCAAVLANATARGATDVKIVATRQVADSLAQYRAAGDASRPAPNTIWNRVPTEDVLEAIGSNIQLFRFDVNKDPHSDGDAIVYFKSTQTIFVVDVVYPGWVPWHQWAISTNMYGFTAAGKYLLDLPVNWQTILGGHLARQGGRIDVNIHLNYLNDVITQTAYAIFDTYVNDLPLIYGDIAGPLVSTNPATPERINWWAVYRRFLDITFFKAITALAPTYGVGGPRYLGGFEVFAYSHSMSARNYLQADTNLFFVNVPGAPAPQKRDARALPSPTPAQLEALRKIERENPLFRAKISGMLPKNFMV